MLFILFLSKRELSAVMPSHFLAFDLCSFSAAEGSATLCKNELEQLKELLHQLKRPLTEKAATSALVLR